MSAEIATAGFDKSPLDWYVEETWVSERLIWAEDRRAKSAGYEPWGIVWDPCCGIGNTLKSFDNHGYKTFGSDLDARGWHWLGAFEKNDFLGGLLPTTLRTLDFSPVDFSIVGNPPFSYQKGIAEAFCLRALSLATNKVAMLLPLKWLASQGRAKLFTEHPPRTIYILRERPSMPPGHLVAERGIAAFERGKMDFMWIVWDVRNPTAIGETRTVWIPPRDEAIRAEERRQRNKLHKANPQWRAKS